MGESAKSQISEKVMVGVISTIILAVLAYLGRSFLLPFLATTLFSVWSEVKKTSAWILGGTVESPVWLFYLLCGASVILLIVAAKKICRKVKINEPSWRDYTEDNFFGIKWRWQYTSTGQLNDPCAYCPTDETILVYRREFDRGGMFIGSSHAITLHCDTCGRQFGPFDGNDTHLCEKVMRQIDRKVRNNEWKTAITTAKATG